MLRAVKNITLESDDLENDTLSESNNASSITDPTYDVGADITTSTTQNELWICFWFVCLFLVVYVSRVYMIRATRRA